MASFNSASSSLPTRKFRHDVFVSFRGEDTRMSFVDHLFAALDRKAIDAFKDNEMPRGGKPLSRALLEAIEESRFAVVVFSENYANSSWCLEELAKIMECRDQIRQRVLPVFYHVEPSDVRVLKRKFATAFKQHEEEFKGEVDKLNKWKEALAAASTIPGWHVSKAVNVGESEVINKIVQVILEGIQLDGDDSDLIGIEYHVDKLESLLCTEAKEEVRVIGIWGMGGIGKTTIARAVYNRFACNFEGSSFVNDVRENSSSKRDICILQKEMLVEILERPPAFIAIHGVDHGANKIRKSCSNKKVFLVLDDVDNVNQLEFLARNREWFGPGSRIIITTRYAHLLEDADFKYEPNCLHVDQAVKLFSRYAFHKNSPPKGYEELSYRAICYTGGLPLALKVLGSFFRGREASVWGSALDRLAKKQDKDIFYSLKLSFDGLDDSEKNIFLDIACFFKGKDIEFVTRILDSFGFDPVIGIEVLRQKSLITVSNNKLNMHDLIQEMGWQIVHQSFSDSRLWKPEEIDDVINGNRKLKAVEAIVLPDKGDKDECDGEKLGLGDEDFRRMKNLRLLDVDCSSISHEPTFLPDKLRWLCWRYYSFSSLPTEQMHKLVGLEMFHGLFKHLWKGPKILPNLKFVDLSSSTNLKRFPNISGAPNMERLILSGCLNLVEVHESLGFHRKLVHLDMSSCWKLKCLPSTIEMESLVTLILSFCRSLERFPKVSQSMTKLSHIHLDGCIQIKKLPSSIRYLSGLRVLSLIGCEKLKKIPNSVCELKDLKIFHLYNCKKLKKLPEELGSMENLEELSLGFSDKWNFKTRLPNSISCRTLTSLCSLRKLDLSYRQIKEEDFPETFHAFSSLEELHLSGNSQLTQLPAGISHLSRLKLLELSECSRLQNLHALPSGIQVLRARFCNSLEKIEDIPKEYDWLYNVWFFDCHKLLQDQENERYIDKMLQLSFLKKCATVGHRLSIAVPGSKIPSWFEEQQHGCKVALTLPPMLHTQVAGFAICGVFHGNWEFARPRIIFRIENDEKVVVKSEVDHIDSAAGDGCNLWVTYIPFGFFQQMYQDFQPQDWSHITGCLVMTLMNTYGNKSVKCGAHVVYKEDVEMIQQKIKTCISDYGNLVQIDHGEDFPENRGYMGKISANTYSYEETFDGEKDKNMMSRRTNASRIHDIYNKSLGFIFHIADSP